MAESASGPALIPGRRDLLWERRWLMLACGVATLAALGLVPTTLDTGPRWPLLGWGTVGGVVLAIAIYTFTSVAIARTDPLSGRIDRLRHRRTVYTGVWLFLGVEAGLLAAVLGSTLVLVIAASCITLVLASGGLLVLVAWRRQQHARGR